CEWLTKKENKHYRLPTEAEWEYACRAGTKTPYFTGTELLREYNRHQEESWIFEKVPLSVASTPPNPWGLYDMHGNVEEWCYDWYGSYQEADQTDPTGRIDGDFKVTRGGSHNTKPEYLRSANRMAMLPDDSQALIGFRVIIGDLPDTELIPEHEKELWAKNVTQQNYDWSNGPKTDEPFFEGPVRFVHIPPNSNGPLFSRHNHCPALTVCPNGDILAIWYTTNAESGRELAIAASRLRAGSPNWDPASPFWDAPDRNDHASDLLWDGQNTLYHFNGISSDATWGKLALILRTSTDNGVTWSKARLIMPEHGLRHMPVAGVFRTREGYIIQPSDAVTVSHGGTAVLISKDNGKTWYDPGEGKPTPEFKAGNTGAWIAGIHAGVVQLDDGSLLAFGRGDSINGRMPQSVSNDMGETWKYSASEFPSINGGQRLVLMRLREGPIILVSFTDSSENRKNPKWPSIDGIAVTDEAGVKRTVYGMFAALSFDQGKTWPVKKLISPGKQTHKLDGGAWTDEFIMDNTHAEPMGYLAATQAPDGVIHLISSALHYRFNLVWLNQPMPYK
ncbi:MAG: SUMF1/EgtB/PvdO family nonheme iron enzyme, partial [Candidatus Latescibacteria bacterium]|nr:SUMF1/EgtB/PvdO family nonheme iron enzyme [Candidatus Latescibacterota bacterium]